MKRFLVLALVLSAVMCFGRSTLDSYSAQAANNMNINYNQTFAVPFNFGERSVVLPKTGTGTKYSQPQKINIDNFDVIRVTDRSTTTSAIASFNVVLNMYQQVISKVTGNIGGVSESVYTATLKLVATENVQLNTNHVTSHNMYNIIDFTVSPKNTGATINITVNITIRNAMSSLASNVTHDAKAITAATATLIDYPNSRVACLTNYGTEPIYIGSSSVTTTNYGRVLSGTYGRDIIFNDTAINMYVISQAQSTLNVLLLK